MDWSEIDSHLYHQMTFDKGDKAIQWECILILINGAEYLNIYKENNEP